MPKIKLTHYTNNVITSEKEYEVTEEQVERAKKFFEELDKRKQDFIEKLEERTRPLREKILKTIRDGQKS